MAARNDERRFGWITRALHWLTALTIFVALPLGLWIAEMEPSLAALKYFGWHKTLGITVLALVLIRMVWHGVSPPPPPLTAHAAWQDSAAKLVHRAFYVLLVAMPMSGWIASSATGIDTVIFSRWTLPRIAPVSEAWEEAAFEAHEVIAWCLVLLIAVHVAGAVHRAVVLKDGTLRRMVSGRL